MKSSACELLTFTVTSHEIAGIVDKATKSVALATTEDLSDVTVECEVSPHATISPDPASVHNLNDPVKFTVTAHDGTTAEYTVAKVVYEKIEQGFNKESVELLFNFDPVASLGMPAFDVEVGPTIAALHGKVVLCAGDGSTPIYINAMTGAKQGEIALGSAIPGAVTNDEGEHLLICNHAGSSETMNIYWTSSVKDTPKLLTSFTNTCDLALGSKIKCIGDVTKDAHSRRCCRRYHKQQVHCHRNQERRCGYSADYRPVSFRIWLGQCSCQLHHCCTAHQDPQRWCIPQLL